MATSPAFNSVSQPGFCSNLPVAGNRQVDHVDICRDRQGSGCHTNGCSVLFPAGPSSLPVHPQYVTIWDEQDRRRGRQGTAHHWRRYESCLWSQKKKTGTVVCLTACPMQNRHVLIFSHLMSFLKIFIINHSSLIIQCSVSYTCEHYFRGSPEIANLFPGVRKWF